MSRAIILPASSVMNTTPLNIIQSFKSAGISLMNITSVTTVWEADGAAKAEEKDLE